MTKHTLLYRNTNENYVCNSNRNENGIMKWNWMDVKHIHWMEYDIEQEYEYSSILNGIYLDVIMSAVYGSITTCRLTVDFVIDVVIEVSSEACMLHFPLCIVSIVVAE